MGEKYVVRPSDDIMVFLIDMPFSHQCGPRINALYNAGIKTGGDLLGYSERELLALEGIGKRYLAHIKVALAKNGYSLRKEV